jgi:hypothetical protein
LQYIQTLQLKKMLPKVNKHPISENSPNLTTLTQRCQMVYFQTKNSNLGKFWRVLQWNFLVYFMVIWSILRPFDKCCGHLFCFVVMWYIFPTFGILHHEISGNPTLTARTTTSVFVHRFWNNLDCCLIPRSRSKGLTG